MLGEKYNGSKVGQQNSVQELTKFEEGDLLTLRALFKRKIDVQYGISIFLSFQDIFDILNNSTIIGWQNLNKGYGK